MDSIKAISDNIAAKSIKLTLFYLHLMQVDEHSETAYAVNNEVIAAAFAMDKLFTRGEYDYVPVLKYYLKEANRDDSFMEIMKSQIDYYLKETKTKDGIAKELTERIVFIQFNRKNAAWGEECPVTPLDLNVFSPNFQVQYMLTEKGEETVLKYLDFQFHFNHLPAPVEKKTESKKDSGNKTEVKNAKGEVVPLTFHKFWINAVLPLSVFGYIVMLISNIMTLVYVPIWGILVTGFNIALLVFAIQAVIGLRSFERKAFVANRRMLIIAIINDVLMMFILMFSDDPIVIIFRLVNSFCNFMVFVYYKNREELFSN